MSTPTPSRRVPASAPAATAGTATDPLVHVTRVFDAPPDLVFTAWTDPKHLLRWYAPNGCTVRFEGVDVRVGGGFRCCIANPRHGDCWVRAEYREVVPGKRLVFTLVRTDPSGRDIDPVDVGMDPEWPRETMVTVTLEPHARGTRLTLDQTVRESIAKRTGAYPSWLEMLDRLAEVLAAA